MTRGGSYSLLSLDNLIEHCRACTRQARVCSHARVNCRGLVFNQPGRVHTEGSGRTNLRRINMADTNLDVRLDSIYERALTVRPRLPLLDGIFDLGPNVLIASHAPHARIKEHLHDHLNHMHIRYGFEFPQQSLIGIDGAALMVVMMIKVDHRVDCNPVFVARGNHNEGICLKIAGEDVHWVHNEEASKKGTHLYEATGRRVPQGYYFSGFYTSDLEERRIKQYSKEELKRAIGMGLRADQHFQATWREPRNESIEPYPVTICLGDDTTAYHVFFELRPTVPLGAF